MTASTCLPLTRPMKCWFGLIGEDATATEAPAVPAYNASAVAAILASLSFMSPPVRRTVCPTIELAADDLAEPVEARQNAASNQRIDARLIELLIKMWGGSALSVCSILTVACGAP